METFYNRTMEVQRFLTLFFNYYNHILSPKFFAINETETEENGEDENKETADNVINDKKEIKYEDKYLDDIRKMDKEFNFTKDEEEQKTIKTAEIYKEILASYATRISEIYNEFKEHERILLKYEGNDDYCICDDEANENNENNENNETKEEIIKNIKEEHLKLFNELENLKQILETEEGKNKCIEESEEQAIQFIIKNRLDKLSNCFVLETTPLGNVLMLYDNERGSFKFYSDNTIPYRYLETIGRKYVKQFNCRPIFVDMEEELRLAEEKWEKDKKEKEEKKEIEKIKNEENIKNNLPIQKKKNIFAKFKSYNKDAGTGHVNISAPPKNSIPNHKITENAENEKILLKEKANRYTYEGKLANFNFLKKIERKVTDKKYAMTFADFKKMQKDKQ